MFMIKICLGVLLALVLFASCTVTKKTDTGRDAPPIVTQYSLYIDDNAGEVVVKAGMTTLEIARLVSIAGALFSSSRVQGGADMVLVNRIPMYKVFFVDGMVSRIEDMSGKRLVFFTLTPQGAKP